MSGATKAGSVVRNNEPFRDLTEEIRKAATMRPVGGAAEAWIDVIIVSVLINYFLLHPRAEDLYRSADGIYATRVAEYIIPASVDGTSLPGFKDRVQAKLKYARQRKDDPDKITKVKTKVATEYELVEISEGSEENQGRAK